MCVCVCACTRVCMWGGATQQKMNKQQRKGRRERKHKKENKNKEKNAVHVTLIIQFHFIKAQKFQTEHFLSALPLVYIFHSNTKRIWCWNINFSL